MRERVRDLEPRPPLKRRCTLVSTPLYVDLPQFVERNTDENPVYGRNRSLFAAVV